MPVYEMKPRKVHEYALEALTAGCVPFIKGPPGIGKSAILKKIARDHNLKMIDHRISTSQPEDFTGLPDFERNDVGRGTTATFRQFDIFPIEGTPLPINPETGEPYDGWLLFLDEFNSGLREVIAAAYKLALDRMVGQSKLHERALVAMAGNNMMDGAIVNNIGTAMQSRLVHINMVTDFREWMEDVAMPQGYDERIRGYISWKQQALMKFDPKHKEDTFPCPRTWEFMNKMIRGKVFRESIDPETNEPFHEMDGKIGLYSGTIGESEACSFVQFCKVTNDIVQLPEILKDPVGCRLHHTAELKYAQITHLMDKVTAQNFADISTYINRFDLSFRVMFYRTIMSSQPTLKTHPAYAKTVMEIAKHLR